MLILDVDTYRYRVVEVLAIGGDDIPYPGEIREFKTWEGAQRYQATARRQGKRVLTQTGMLHWLNADELEAEVVRLTPKVRLP